LQMAVTSNFNVLINEFQRLPYAPYAPVRNQCRQLLRAVNKSRNLAGLEALPQSVLSTRRRAVGPFQSDVTGRIPRTTPIGPG
jgi:hypothetical protein